MENQFLDEFSQYLRLQNLAEGTIRNYLYELRKLPTDKDKQTEFLIVNRHRKMMMAAYRKYLHYLKSIGSISGETLFNRLDTYKLPKRRGSVNKGNWYKQDEWETIVANGANRRAKMFLWIGFHFGLRLGEIINLRIEDIDLENNRILVRQRPGWSPKHFRDRTVPMTKVQKRIFTRWIRERPALNHSYLLWAGRKKKQVGSRTAQRWAHMAHQGLKPHDLRRSFAKVLYYNSDKDLKLVQVTLGHASISTTSAYLGLEEEEIQEKYTQAMT